MDELKRRFAARLKELRLAAGMTQKQLAAKAGMTTAAISDFEQARYVPSWETVLKLKNALGVSCEEFDREPQTPAPAPEKRTRKRR
jgi:transcriptional regulator with XRE-family HTH domain